MLTVWVWWMALLTNTICAHVFPKYRLWVLWAKHKSRLVLWTHNVAWCGSWPELFCQLCDTCIYLGLWGHGDLTDLDHPFLEFFLAVGSNVQQRAHPHGGIRHQREDMRPAALPFRTHNWEEIKEKSGKEMEWGGQIQGFLSYLNSVFFQPLPASKNAKVQCKKLI